ncbi:transposase [Streptomyces halstedii]|uniref:transposase n=1 Tax=Streptomyces halstedii TaxID=1944 RepID=UPI0037FA5E39
MLAAAGARRDGQAQREPSGGLQAEPDDHGQDRSRGGFTTKIHLACEQGQRPLSLLVTAGQRGDSPQFAAVLEGIRVPRTGPGRPRVRPLRLRGDKAYSSRANGPTCESAGSGARSRSPPIRPGTASGRGGPAGGPRPSTARTTRPGTRSSAGSTGSSATGRWPHGSTHPWSASRPPSW